ncbi:Retrovirus-related Pol polyprotein from type-2 retrotransposable element R2DM [Sesamum angolense]|uniref:Retrovirus-related Pol polyprotein from type-2 retrotransposable element R2DM n=1 Tax=Sesamum angolense TaxID=2727404 RepID=A0AAE1T8S5_9LAMI|nr:Retrovirus-related Pol polyprotein from type-2 retrotransposable element R2DM [Sesamum angolense]
MTMAMNKQTPPLLAVSLWIFPGFVGGDRTDRAIDLRYLRPWARHILTDDEARAIIHPVTIDEVKTTFFNIEEDKAPGPDGFSSGFFKAAWPVVGGEVSNTFIDFFKTGRLLKQLNATVLTLIPKILVSRIRESLDLLISPSQNAFVLGRLISDNVLLAQELFSGYNQCRLPPRCALKVDLRKAYDTVEWDFLIATLRMFGFPAMFIRWIEECVTSAHYSVVVNGRVHGFFVGARGLRQGDPMSPYLFVLVMEVLHMILQQLIEQDGEFGYHWRCQELNLFQLSFADDLLLLGKADVRSEGHLSVRYLGLPLISERLSIADRQPLLQKIDSLIKGWEGVQFSFAGRVQLIKSVLISFEVYWAMAFILPKGIIKEMIKRLRTFLWKGTFASGYSKVAWEAVCRPIEEGGLGIKDILALNHALMSNHLWAVIKQDRTSIWVD